jgi:hypothetical protein
MKQSGGGAQEMIPKFHFLVLEIGQCGFGLVAFRLEGFLTLPAHGFKCRGGLFPFDAGCLRRLQPGLFDAGFRLPAFGLDACFRVTAG